MPTRLVVDDLGKDADIRRGLNIDIRCFFILFFFINKHFTTHVYAHSDLHMNLNIFTSILLTYMHIHMSVTGCEPSPYRQIITYS